MFVYPGQRPGLCCFTASRLGVVQRPNGNVTTPAKRDDISTGRDLDIVVNWKKVGRSMHVSVCPEKTGPSFYLYLHLIKRIVRFNRGG